MRALAWAFFLLLLLLILSPIDALPGPVDDFVYFLLDILIGIYLWKKRKHAPMTSQNAGRLR